jgi:hypothetical protein
VQPKCGQTEERTINCPLLSFVTYTAFSETALRQPSTCWIWMVFWTGSDKDENSLKSPTGDALSSVVRRKRGKRVKRINGTESSAPTQTVPVASRAPRKERRFFDGGPGVVDLFFQLFQELCTFQLIESSCTQIFKKSWSDLDRPSPGRDIQTGLLFLGKLPDVGYE